MRSPGWLRVKELWVTGWKTTTRQELGIPPANWLQIGVVNVNPISNLSEIVLPSPDHHDCVW